MKARISKEKFYHRYGSQFGDDVAFVWLPRSLDEYLNYLSLPLPHHWLSPSHNCISSQPSTTRFICPPVLYAYFTYAGVRISIKYRMLCNAVFIPRQHRVSRSLCTDNRWWIFHTASLLFFVRTLVPRLYTENSRSPIKELRNMQK